MNRDKKAETTKSLLEINFENKLLSNKRSVGMKRVITYGTFDLLHYGHINLLKGQKRLVIILLLSFHLMSLTGMKRERNVIFPMNSAKL